MKTKISVNGRGGVPFHVAPESTLLDFLREILDLTGTKYGCGDGKCGACTVLIDGKPVQACSVIMGDLDAEDVTTIEGVASEERGLFCYKLHPLQEAMIEAGAFQCGYCTPGMVMSALGLLASNPSPSRDEIVEAMQDNICRCGLYQRIVDAIAAAAEAMASGSPEPAKRGWISLSPRGGWPDDSEGVDGIVVAFACEDVDRAREEAGIAAQPLEQRPPSEIGPWIHISESGSITVYTGKAEVGQNIRSSLAQIVGEELRVPADEVRVVLGNTAWTPYDRGTFGSRTTPITGRQLFKAGAAMRELLAELAAATWGTDSDHLIVADGRVEDPVGGRSFTYGQLASDRQLLKVADDDQPTTPAEAWTIAGQSISKTTPETFVVGEHRYASDWTDKPGRVCAKILRPPAFGAALIDIDVTAAEQIIGVTVLHGDDYDEQFVAVIARDAARATLGLDAIRARWKTELQISQPELFDYIRANPDSSPTGKPPFQHVAGSVDRTLAAADVTHQARYTVNYIAHAPMEPRAALAMWQDHRLWVWTGTQRPFGVRAQLGEFFDMPVDQVRVIVPDTGSGFGGKHSGDAAIEAARVAKVVGKPVKLVWTREEEFTWAVFRPAGLIEVTSAVTREGNITALEFHNYNSGAAGIETDYDIPNQHIEFHPADSPLREGAYRALSTTANTFARETHLDELARLLEIDPLDLRLRNLSDERQIAVLTAAAEVFGWRSADLSTGHGVGIACGHDKGSYVAACAEVRVDPSTGALQVLRVVEAFECGAIINPENLRSQIEGAIVQGLGGALFESIRFANGRILNPTFTDYRVPRFADAPRIETVLLNRPDLDPAGAGETPIVVIAPAVGNAIFDACGVRLRAMPMAPEGAVKRA